MQTIDPDTQVPPPGVFPTRQRRPAPFLWSQRDICRLLDGARALRSPLRAATHEALFGLLATSGMRVGEAIALQRDDVDLEAGVITIREAKFGRSRLVPVGRGNPDFSCCDLVILVDEAAEHITTPDRSSVAVR